MGDGWQMETDVSAGPLVPAVDPWAAPDPAVRLAQIRTRVAARQGTTWYADGGYVVQDASGARDDRGNQVDDRQPVARSDQVTAQEIADDHNDLEWLLDLIDALGGQTPSATTSPQSVRVGEQP